MLERRAVPVGPFVAGIGPATRRTAVLVVLALFAVLSAQPAWSQATCTWNPAGLGANDWTNPAKWSNCSGGAGPGPANTPGLADTAIVGTVNLDVPVAVEGWARSTRW